MRTALKSWFLNSGGGSTTPWWLGNGAVEASDGDTIYDPYSSSSLAESLVNLANPGTRDATTPGNAPTFTTNAWVFVAASSQYIHTNTLCTQNQTILIWFEDWSGSYLIGSFSNSGGLSRAHIRPQNGAQFEFRKESQQLFDFQQVGGILGLTDYPNINGMKLGVLHSTITGTNPQPYIIGGLMSNGVPQSFGSGKVHRVAIYNRILTEEQTQAVAKTMFGQQSYDSYANTVLALNPIAYYPCNHDYGSCLFDISGNEAHASFTNLGGGFSAGFSGQHGKAVGGANIPANSLIRGFPQWGTRIGIDLNSFSFACWARITRDATDQVRFLAIAAGSQTEYYYIEFRGGVNLDVFHRENGVTENSSALRTINDNNWHHIVGYNDSANQKSGIYLDGVKAEYSKTSTGFTTGIPDAGFASWFDVKGEIQHIAFFDHPLSQSEVNSLIS